ncbi:hypothetical protein Mal52_13630 [Symmachiella dynata]|uniref:Uncharacterized protein n=1 Tax=Symmachiella dynata TaxID=2527995 RepID=A0A517ZK69_9PLAN|nr:helix-turn-helix domain-containing protein [Symmachiella dynata]QDU42894.1 hypothetical protein Mal52_13630 [Symmachiella dynata]
MGRQRYFENLDEMALVGHDGTRLDRRMLDLDRDRAVRLARDVQQACEMESERLKVGLLHSEGFAQRQIATEIGKNASTVSRQLPRTMLLLRASITAMLLDQWLRYRDCCMISLQTARPLDWQQDRYLVAMPGHRRTTLIRPRRDYVNRILRKQRSLLERAADLDADDGVPCMAVWQELSTCCWCIDFSLLYADRDQAMKAACENDINAIFHVASGRLDTL